MMKVKLLNAIFFVLFLNNVFSQEYYIITTEGEKITVGGDKVKLLPSFDEFEYQESGSNKKSKIKLSKIKSADFLGFYHIQTFTINKKPKPCFIIAETPEKKLVGYGEIHTYTSFTGPDKSNTTTYFKYFYDILDRQNNPIEELRFSSIYLENDNDKFDKRDDVEVILRKHFSDCPDLISRLNAYDPNVTGYEAVSKSAKKWTKKYEEANAKVLYLFNDPDYSSCDKPTAIASLPETKGQVVAIASDNSQFDGTYNYSSLTMEYRGSKRDMPIKGTWVIKDGFVVIGSKDASVKYKIKNIQDGVIYCEDRNMTHVIKITLESGKKKGMEYNTRINIIMDHQLGGSITDYWCIKE